MENACNTLKSFRLTEKSSQLSSARNCYVFEVERNVTKRQIMEAVREIFGVRPLCVRTLLQKGKIRRHRFAKRGRTLPVRQPMLRKALVTLQLGDKIEIL